MASMSLPLHVHQVFLSYRGQQLRYSFISHLTDAFQRHGFKSFQDKDEQRGKNLTNLFVRIQESRIALVIFSNRYGESRWCLEELVKIKKLAEKGKIEVIPIFYNVKAREVRWQTGEFGDKFWTLAKASSGDEIKKWKDALEYISNKMGLSLREKRSEADFIKNIIKEVKRVAAAIERDERRKRYVIALKFYTSRDPKPTSLRRHYMQFHFIDYLNYKYLRYDFGLN